MINKINAKKIIKMLLIMLLVLAIFFASFTFFDNHYSEESKTLILSGLNQNISVDANKSIVDDVTFSKTPKTKIYLQMYNYKTNQWLSKKSFTTNDSTFNIVYPKSASNYGFSRWRIYVPETSTNNKFTSKTVNISNKNIKELKLHSKSAVIIDAKTHQVVYDKNMSKQLPMASTTKIMTALITLENCSLDDKVKINNKSMEYLEGSFLMFTKGETFYVKDLFASMMLPSANDAAQALAIYQSGSTDAFAKEMNEKASKLGLKNTNFVNPHGLHDKNQYSTTYDMSVIFSELIKNEDYIKIAQLEDYEFYSINKKEKRYVVNTNKLLKYYPKLIAGKTGYTSQAGYCFVGAYTSNGRTYVYCTLGAKDIDKRWSDDKKLMKYIDTYC